VDKTGGFGGTWWWNKYSGLIVMLKATSTCPCWRRRATCSRTNMSPGPS
jgi:hypothetical protein